MSYVHIYFRYVRLGYIPMRETWSIIVLFDFPFVAWKGIFSLLIKLYSPNVYTCKGTLIDFNTTQNFTLYTCLLLISKHRRDLSEIWQVCASNNKSKCSFWYIRLKWTLFLSLTLIPNIIYKWYTSFLEYLEWEKIILYNHILRETTLHE